MNVELQHSTESNQCKRCDYIRELLTWPTSSETNTIDQDNNNDDLYLHAELNTMGLVVGLNIE